MGELTDPIGTATELVDDADQLGGGELTFGSCLAVAFGEQIVIPLTVRYDMASLNASTINDG